MNHFGLDNTYIRQKNLGFVLEALITGKCQSRIELARISGLSKMSATNLIAELVGNHYLEERKEAPNGRGRPQSALVLSPLAPKAICLFLGERSSVVSLTALDGTCLHKETMAKHDGTLADFLAKLFDAIDKSLRNSLKEKIIGFSISSALPSSSKEGSISLGKETIALREELMSRYQMPSYLLSEVDALAAKEKIFGYAKPIEDYLFLLLNEQIESSAFSQGRLFQNAQGKTPDIAHLSIDYNGLSCSCGGKGCLDTYVSASAMEKKLKEITKLKVPFSGFCELQSKKNDPRMDWAFKDMMDKLAVAITSFAHLFHPSTVIIGGQGVLVPDRYYQKLEKGLGIAVRKSDFPLKDQDGGAIAPLLLKIFNGEIALI